jgi:hypothetical protein
MQAYAQEHGVFELLSTLMKDLLVARPADPLAHLLTQLAAPPVAVRALILGSPGSGKRTLAAALAAHAGVPAIDAMTVFAEQAALLPALAFLTLPGQATVVGLGIIVSIMRRRNEVTVDDLVELKG